MPKQFVILFANTHMFLFIFFIFLAWWKKTHFYQGSSHVKFHRCFTQEKTNVMTEQMCLRRIIWEFSFVIFFLHGHAKCWKYQKMSGDWVDFVRVWSVKAENIGENEVQFLLLVFSLPRCIENVTKFCHFQNIFHSEVVIFHVIIAKNGKKSSRLICNRLPISLQNYRSSEWTSHFLAQK